MTHGQ